MMNNHWPEGDDGNNTTMKLAVVGWGDTKQ